MTPISSILEQLQQHYSDAVKTLREDVIAFGRDGTIPPARKRQDGSYAYPELTLRYSGRDSSGADADDRTRAFGRLEMAGTYTTTITRPDLFAPYLKEQLDLIAAEYEINVTVGRSRQEIPFPYVLDGEAGAAMVGIAPQEIAQYFPSTDLALIGDELADGIEFDEERDMPLSLFDALRTDYSLARLAHYTGTRVEDFQDFILFTNYHRYVDEFVNWGAKQIGKGGYTDLTGAGGLHITDAAENAQEQLSDTAWRRHQMPAYHLIREDGRGITLVNIGVGPSNAKTICDHLAVLRPHAWLMIGHCGGLRSSQKIGDFVLAHAYLRDDHVLDDVLPPEIPIPPIAEVQQALAGAAEEVSGVQGANLKQRMRTGTVVTTDDRNWELRYSSSAFRFSQSRAIAIEMESATIATQGYRFRVPYGTLLCVSDKPLHGEIKLPGQANKFYEEAIAAHLQIGLETCKRLRDEGDRLHSRKLRAFNEPPFR
ncbi:AMP nucleosidase [Erythrobacter litoralis]|jgi:AMP nucleosidase|uniref:AMP nucleosidase n=1 Tax=Erythrobacter litoralis TaxID=39960 RepID=A0A074N3N7_9SPHN|nr:AMP nucleosidase [Erythrobacter litoralis]AOL23303.1 AMP nucleosidase [Erythrobacter litoralis]KEO92552.1 AMP nucleosidase [Erythrobacter litoralis]MEE4339870.1 AMP nucleosidase [Erythrobacter sp.]